MPIFWYPLVNVSLQLAHLLQSYLELLYKAIVFFSILALLSILFKTPWKWKLNFSRSALFHIKTRVCVKYFVNDCWQYFIEWTIIPNYFNLWRCMQNSIQCKTCTSMVILYMVVILENTIRVKISSILYWQKIEKFWYYRSYYVEKQFLRRLFS